MIQNWTWLSTIFNEKIFRSPIGILIPSNLFTYLMRFLGISWRVLLTGCNLVYGLRLLWEGSNEGFFVSRTVFSSYNSVLIVEKKLSFFNFMSKSTLGSTKTYMLIVLYFRIYWSTIYCKIFFLVLVVPLVP